MFEIVIRVWFNIDYEDEPGTPLKDENRKIKFLSEENVTPGWLQQNGFDGIAIEGYDSNGAMPGIHIQRWLDFQQ